MHKVFHAQNIQSSVSLGYGYSYNWFTAIHANVAPTDWKVPTLAELNTLSTSLGGDTVSGGKLKEVGLTHWDAPNTGADNSSGFTAVGNGYRSTSGNYAGLKEASYIWSLTENNTTSAHFINVVWWNTETTSSVYGKEGGQAIRLLYTGSGTPTTLTDYDGNIYNVVLIGSQYWIGENWKCTHLNDGTVIPNVTDGTAWSNLTTPGLCAYDNDENNV